MTEGQEQELRDSDTNRRTGNRDRNREPGTKGQI